jgi:hypothetical protein
VAIDRVIRRPDAIGVALLALVTALQFRSGTPRSSFHIGVAAVLFGALRLSRAPGERARRAGVAVWGLARGRCWRRSCCCPSSSSWRTRATSLSGRAARRAPAPRLPAVGGDARVLGPPDAGDAPAVHQRAGVLHGALPLLLALIAVLRPTRERIALLATAIVCLAVAAGSPPFFQVANHLPGFSTAINTRWRS